MCIDAYAQLRRSIAARSIDQAPCTFGGRRKLRALPSHDRALQMSRHPGANVAMVGMGSWSVPSFRAKIVRSPGGSALLSAPLSKGYIPNTQIPIWGCSDLEQALVLLAGPDQGEKGCLLEDSEGSEVHDIYEPAAVEPHNADLVLAHFFTANEIDRIWSIGTVLF
jgi:hypothetical protein